MPYHLLFRNINKQIELGSEHFAFVSDQFKAREFKRGSNIQRASRACKEIHFVEKGMLRAYFTTEDGKESTVMFAMEDWWITDMYAFTNNKPAMLTIEVMKECRILSLRKENLEMLFEGVPRFERFFRILMQNAYVREQLRVIENLSLPAEQRYANFIQKYPQIVEHITQKQIASYLGITPEFLSTIRSAKKSTS